MNDPVGPEIAESFLLKLRFALRKICNASGEKRGVPLCNINGLEEESEIRQLKCQFGMFRRQQKGFVCRVLGNLVYQQQ